MRRTVTTMSDNELFGNSEQLNPEAHIERTETHACDCISRQAVIYEGSGT